MWGARFTLYRCFILYFLCQWTEHSDFDHPKHVIQSKGRGILLLTVGMYGIRSDEFSYDQRERRWEIPRAIAMITVRIFLNRSL